jgi:hypothetical protein
VADKIAALLSLFRGTAAFEPEIKDLYDYGLVKRVNGTKVTPCSLMACEALSYLFANLQSEDQPLSRLHGADRGIELERQILRAIMRIGSVPLNFTVHRARSPSSTSELLLGATVVQTTDCDKLSDIVALPAKRSLWIPSSPMSEFDGILMPAYENLSTQPMVVFDPSVTDPYVVKRREKAHKLVKFCGILQEKYSEACPPVPLVMWDGDLSSLELSDEVDKLAEGMPADVMIMDRSGLRALKVVL